MSSFKSDNQLRNLNPSTSEPVSSDEVQQFDLENQLAELAVPLAQAWKDNHPEAQPASEADLDVCTLAVAIEMAIAGEAVGGPIGALIASGGGVKAASVACRRVL
ncbi:hypothetical protein [Coleofasciculus sp. E1-EBD-02]|jgi:hypothetical protein|uniref:hypothetical protein n=1 Tax=Coleofasciculus sp. E1-EBD-02 TaxID=3068481 RepID=UPI0032F32122